MLNGTLKFLLRHLKIDIRRTPGKPLPMMYRDPLEAMAAANSGLAVAIECALDACVIFNGLSFSSTGWHPFVETAKEFLAGSSNYSGSTLERYYEYWQPRDGLDALIGATNGPEILRSLPSYVMHSPWIMTGLNKRLEGIESIARLENTLFGDATLTIADGHGLQGPVSQRKAALEHRRLTAVTSSLRDRGYDRTQGDIAVQVLKRGHEYRFRIAHGHHRAAALAALGYSHAPCSPRMLVDRDDIERWPQVSNGTWTIEQALVYFNHHFDFDSRAWARHTGCLIEESE